MRRIADLHVHSRYAGACSEALTLENINRTAIEKGIDIIGTGDFTHPNWFSEIKAGMEEDGGVYRLKGARSAAFVLSSEVCTISNEGKGFKKIHHCMLAPDLGAVQGINEALGRFGNLKSDGRPILSISPCEFVETVRSVDKNIMVFPAHAWTPWYGVFGSYGFSSIEEAYGDQGRHIKALETGLSSDPAMNWRVSALDKYSLVSGSDAHSLPKLGREAVIFNTEEEPSYRGIVNGIERREFEMTVEFYPEEGKYHFDGHRKCGVSFSPQEARKYNGICPACRRKLTMGVLHRIEDLADRKEGEKPAGAIPYVSMVPLQEIIAYVRRKSPASEYVKSAYGSLVRSFGSEFRVLLDSTTEEIAAVDKELALAIDNVRERRVSIVPGYDGIFGIVDILSREPVRKSKGSQKIMSDF